MKVKLNSYKLLFHFLDLLSNSKWLHKLVINKKVYLGVSIISLTMMNSACSSDKDNANNENPINYSNKDKNSDTTKTDSESSSNNQGPNEEPTKRIKKQPFSTTLCYISIDNQPTEEELDYTELYPFSFFEKGIDINCYDIAEESEINDYQTITDKYNDHAENILSANGVYIIAEKMPEFRGGNDSLQKYITSNLKYPKTAIENKESGVVYVKFIVEKDGTITNASVVKSLSQKLDSEALRLVKKMPEWKPGSIDSESVRVWVFLPIKFKVD